MKTGRIGAPASIPKPSAGVAQEALNLIAAFGGGANTKKILEDMIRVQGHNEAVLASAKEAIAEADARIKAAEQAEAAGEKSALKREDRVAKAEQKLQADRASHDARVRADLESSEATRTDLTAREEAIVKRENATLHAESVVMSRQSALDLAERETKEARESAKAMQAEWDAKLASLEAVTKR